MPETFLILLAGGIMLAAGVSDPRQVTLRWLRQAGILALAVGGLSMFFASRRPTSEDRSAMIATAATLAAVLGQLGFVQTASLRAGRVFAWVGFFAAVSAGADYLGAGRQQMDGAARASAYASSIGIAAMTGLALMDMLLWHAYLTASKMTIAPFQRLNTILGGALLWRAMLSIAGAIVMQRYYPAPMLWGVHGLYILTRWFVGLGVPAAFIYMAHDCIKRRATQSATGILYVAGVLIFIGELIALYLVRATGLPF
jgi:hypothetical protein